MSAADESRAFARHVEDVRHASLVRPLALDAVAVLGAMNAPAPTDAERAEARRLMGVRS